MHNKKNHIKMVTTVQLLAVLLVIVSTFAIIEAGTSARMRGDVQDEEEIPLKGCLDMDEECIIWASVGECKKNPTWMMPNCPVSCGLCGKKVKCMDLYRECTGWANEGECTENRIWMFFNCPKSCSTCDQAFTGW